MCYDNPVKFVDPDGRAPFSTHTDSNGNVLAVYNDGNLGIYKHSNAEIKNVANTGQKFSNSNRENVGVTLHENSFKAGDKIDFGSHQLGNWLNNFELKMQTQGYLGSKVSLFAYGINAKNNAIYDVKSKIFIGSQVTEGVYFSPRDAGNYAAGSAGRITGAMSKKELLVGYGAFQVSGNGLTDFVKNFSSYRQEALQIGFPTYGEGERSNYFQRLGYEGINTLEKFNSNYSEIWNDKK